MDITTTRPLTRWHQAWTQARRIVRRLWEVAARLGLLALIVLLVGEGVVVDESLRGRATALARPYLFDYAEWEIDALWGKLRQELFGVGSYLDEEARHAQVLAYLTTLAQVQQLEAQIERIYADPEVSDPAAASANLRAERDVLRRELAGDQPLVESVIEEQVSAVLVDEGFGVLGQVLPPVSMHFSEVPTLLVISPRDRIDFAVDINLVALPVDERAALETRIDGALDVASLVVPLGGLSLYPSMILETADPARAFEVTAHEWSHHYLMFFPLGLEYSARPETRIINETAATMFGRAVALKVLARYYPELTPPAYPSFLAPAPAPGPADEPAFDFGREMHRTRVMVDWMLARGLVESAERYMEFRRRDFVLNGYTGLRKLNQAYFAFYGGYQGEPGEGGDDPIGPAIEELLTLSPDLASFLDTMRDVTTREALLAALDDARAAVP